MDGFHKLNHYNYTQFLWHDIKSHKESLERIEQKNLRKHRSGQIKTGDVEW
jgi:hypothetical protein